jgi:hypothetical protein
LEILGFRDCCFSFLLEPRVEQDWTPSTVMLSHLQKLTKHGFTMVVDLMACRVLEDPVFLMPAEGYVVSFVAIYKRGFSTSSHRFLCSLLKHYGIELHNQTPSRVLHIAAFMTLCKAYLGIDTEFNLWNYFFSVWRL